YGRYSPHSCSFSATQRPATTSSHRTETSLPMTSQAVRRLRLAALALILSAPLAAHAQSSTAKIVRAANAFLATLDPAQKQRVLFAWDDEKQRARWSNLPTKFVARAGLAMGELNAAQRTAAMTMLSSALSPRGFEKVQQIVEG